jgi:pyruvate formate lyase activating enzyme
MAMIGHIHSTESFGTVDGPGVRFVVFFKGCPMRCQYCHNPDTWEPGGGMEMTVDEIIAAFEKNRSFYRQGGITATGGEPLMQIDFLTELFERAHEEGIHTCLDTSGIIFQSDNEKLMEKFDRLMKVTDLVMLDIKHIDPEEHLKLTAQPNTEILKFAKYLEKKEVPVWIRHVVVPGITDNPVYLEQLGAFIGSLHNLKALDVLPYHTMGESKYKNMGIPYPLAGVPAMDKEKAIQCKEIIMKPLKEKRKEWKNKEA